MSIHVRLKLIWNPPNTWHIRVPGTWRTAACGRKMPKKPEIKEVTNLAGLTICQDCINKY